MNNVTLGSIIEQGELLERIDAFNAGAGTVGGAARSTLRLETTSWALLRATEWGLRSRQAVATVQGALTAVQGYSQQRALRCIIDRHGDPEPVCALEAEERQARRAEAARLRAAVDAQLELERQRAAAVPGYISTTP